MRIILVNWARIWDGAGYGGGVNGYCQSLALALLQRGHDVYSLCGGRLHVRSPDHCFILRHPDWLGVRVFEVVNSPVLSPSIVQFQRPSGEVASPELETLVGDLFDRLRPDVIHWHNIEGFSVGCVDRALKPRADGTRARVIFSLHNYHTVCPQVYLMQGHERVCHDWRGGHACVNCMETPDPDAERERLIREYESQHPAPAPAAPAITPVVDPRAERRAAAAEVRSLLAWPVRLARAGLRLARAYSAPVAQVPPPAPPKPTPPAPVPLPGPIVRPGDDLSAALPSRGDDRRGQTEMVLAERRARAEPDPADPRRLPLLNRALPDPPSDLPPNDYTRRRQAMVDMLSRCDRVLAVSSFVQRKFEALGVRPEREGGPIRTLPIGTRIGAIVEQARELVFDPPRFERDRPRPVRLVFMGYNHYYKGLHVLSAALERLSADDLRRIDLSIYALDGQSIEWVFRRLEPRLARLTFVPGYRYHDIPWMLGGKDLGVVSSVWWDNAPQTVFEFFACGVPVLGAEVGGIPDFVREGENGLLFRGNDADDLARRLREVVAEPWMLDRLRAQVRPPKDMQSHVDELEAIYAGREIPRASPQPVG